MTPPTRSRWPTVPRCACGDVGPWRPSGGCEHDECELVELEVEAWRVADLDRDNPGQSLAAHVATIECADYYAHQSAHRLVGGGWTCDACEVPGD